MSDIVDKAIEEARDKKRKARASKTKVATPKLKGTISLGLPHVEISLGACWYCGNTATKACCRERLEFLRLSPDEQETIRKKVFREE